MRLISVEINTFMSCIAKDQEWQKKPELYSLVTCALKNVKQGKDFIKASDLEKAAKYASRALKEVDDFVKARQ